MVIVNGKDSEKESGEKFSSICLIEAGPTGAKFMALTESGTLYEILKIETSAYEGVQVKKVVDIPIHIKG